MDSRIPTRALVWVLSAFALGIVSGFTWSVLHRRPDTSYREELARDRYSG